MTSREEPLRVNAPISLPSAFPHVLWARRECPLCSSLEFRQAEAKSMDGVMKWLSLRPVRCVNCWRRYYWFAKE